METGKRNQSGWNKCWPRENENRKMNKKETHRNGKTLYSNSQVNKRRANKNNEQKTTAHIHYRPESEKEKTNEKS